MIPTPNVIEMSGSKIDSSLLKDQKKATRYSLLIQAPGIAVGPGCPSRSILPIHYLWFNWRQEELA